LCKKAKNKKTHNFTIGALGSEKSAEEIVKEIKSSKK